MESRSGTLRLVAIVLALLGAGACLALAWVSSYLPFGRSYTDGRRLLVDAPELHRRVVVHGESERWLQELSPDRSPRSKIALSPDGRIAVFAALGANERMDLFWSERIGERWLSRGPLLALNQPMAHEIAPCFDADGALYFASDRPGSLGFDLYVASFDGTAFRDLYRLSDEEVNGPWDEVDPCFDSRKGELYFASNRPRREGRDEGADFDLFRVAFRADGTSGGVERLESVASTADERSPALHPSGGTLLFASRRSGGAGGFDLYAAASAGPRAGFQAPELLPGGLNSTDDELDPGYLEGGFAFAFRRAPAAAAFSGPGRAVAESGGAEDAPSAELAPAEEQRFGLWRVPSLELERLPGALGALDFALLAAALALIALLVWLGRRWNALDILTKALVISLLIHVLLLVLSRRVNLESEVPAPRAAPVETLLDVAFVPQEDASMAMRGGAVERELAEQELASESPAELASAEERELAPSEAPAELAPAERASFEAALPERSAEAKRPTEAEVASVDLQAPAAPAIEQTNAPELAVPEARESTAKALASVAFEEAPIRATEAPAEARERAGPSSAAPSPDAPVRTVTEVAALERREAPLERAAAEPTTPSVALAEPSAPQPLESAPAAGASEVLAEAPRTLAPPRTSSSAEFASPEGRPGPPPASTERAAVAPSRGAAPLSAPERRAAATGSALARAESRPERRAGSPASVVPVRSPLESLPRSTPSTAPATSPVSEDLLADLGAAPRRTEAPRSFASADPSGPPALSAPGERSVALQPSAPTRAAAPALERAGTASGTAIPRGELAPERSLAEARSFANPSMPRLPSGAGSPAQPVPAATPAAEAGAEMLADLEPSRGLEPRPSRAPLGARLGEGPRALPSPVGAAPRLAGPAPGPAPEVARAEAPLRPAGSSGSPSIALERAPAGVDRRFERRFGDQKTRALEEGGGSVQTEQAVQAGLRYLASKQDGRGFWGDAKYKHAKYAYTIYGKSGLALLAFLGAGHTQSSGTEFSPVVARGIQFLLRAQDARSGHFGNCSSYGHAIATYALCESYALTKDPALREPLQRALDWIVSKQNRQTPGSSEFGGWTYYYPDEREFDPYARASISSWQVMALESGRIGGLDVSPAVLTAARQFLEGCFDANQGWFRYNHQPSRLRSVYQTLPGSTPASLFALRLLGTAVDHRLYEGAWAYTMERRPKSYRRPRENDFVLQAAGNLYFWYYGTLAFFQRGGEEWKAWNGALKGVLLPAQAKDGSWRPIEPYAETAGDTEEDRIYTTAMCVLMLEVYYRYFTPLLTKR